MNGQPTGGGATPTLINSSFGSAAGAVGYTTSAVNCTGATYVVVVAGNFSNTAISLDLSDSQSNTYVTGTDFTTGSGWHISFFVASGAVTTSAAMTWTITNAHANYSTIVPTCWSNVTGSLITQTGNSSVDAGATLQPGSISYAAGNLAILGTTWGAAGNTLNSVDSSMILITNTPQASNGVSIGAYYKIQTGALNPTLTYTAATQRVATLANFAHL